MVADAVKAPDAEPKAKVFISYSRKDMAFADRLEAALKARGFEPLIDRTEIYAFEDWWKRIEALIGRHGRVRTLARRGGVGRGAQGGQARSCLEQAHCADRLPARRGRHGARGAAAAEFHLRR